MACGLPVVCSRRGGAADSIRHGVDGFTFDDEAEALEVLRRLQRDPELRRRVGRAARRTVERVFSEEMAARVRAFYLGGGEAGFDAAAELRRGRETERAGPG